LLYLLKNNISIDIINYIIEFADQYDILLNINEKDIDGNFPLLLAVNHNDLKILKCLVEYSKNHNIILNFNIKDNDGNTPLMKAIINKSPKLIKRLFKYSENLWRKKFVIDIVFGKFIKSYEKKKVYI